MMNLQFWMSNNLIVAGAVVVSAVFSAALVAMAARGGLR